MRIYEIVLLLIFFLSLLCLLRSSESPPEKFSPWLNYSRAYPGTFSYKYSPYYRAYYNSWPGNVRYNPSYWDYWYIPAHSYLDNWINGAPVANISDCIIPPLISETCMQEEIQRTGNLDLSTLRCTIPATLTDACPRNISFGYEYQDYISPTRIIE